MIDDRLRGAGPAAIEVTVVGGENEPVVAKDVDDMSELAFVRFEREIKLAALQQLARLGFQVGSLNPQDFVVLIHAVKPIGQPAAAGFQKDKAQPGKAVEHALA